MMSQAQDPIRLGLLAPFSGLALIYGPSLVWAARIACDEINQAGGLLGRPLELIVEDDGSMPPQAVAAASRLVEQHQCVALIGSMLSNARIAIADKVARPKQIPYLNFSSYEGSINNPYFFHFAAIPNQQVDTMVRYMGEHFGLKMFFAGSNYEWPRGSIAVAKQVLHSMEGEVVGEAYLPLGATDEQIDTMLATLARSGADVFVPWFPGTDLMRLLQRFTERGLKRHMAVVIEHFDEVMASHLAPSVREDLYSGSTYFMSLDTPGNRKYLTRLGQLPEVDGIWPRGNGLANNFCDAVWLCVHAFAAAVTRAGSLDVAQVVAELEQTRLLGPQGEVMIDAASHHAHVNVYLARCKATGGFSILKRFRQIAPVIADCYRMRRGMPLSASINPNGANTGHMLALADAAICALDASGVIQATNPGLADMFGYELAEMTGLPFELLWPPHLRAQFSEQLQLMLHQDQGQMPAKLDSATGYRKDGSLFPLHLSLACAEAGENGSWVLTLRDMTEHRVAEGDMLWRASHDALTGLPSRSLLCERLDGSLQRSRRNGSGLALLFVGLDEFEEINETHGHEIGDGLLQVVAKRLLDDVRPGDTVARLSGAEFAVLCEQLEQPTTIGALAERLNNALRQPTEIHDVAFSVTARIGIAVGHGNSHTSEDLLRAAASAMASVKKQQSDSWQFFNSQFQEKARLRRQLIHGLQVALTRHEISALLQPVMQADSAQLAGMQLQLRWHSISGEIGAVQLMQLAESAGQSVAIGNWALRQACQYAMQSDWGSLAQPFVLLHVSTRQLREENLADQFAAILRESATDPGRIVLAIDETALMSESKNNVATLRKLTQMGLRLAVDDFGVGLSSLARLTHWPVEMVKLDASLLEHIDTKPSSRSLLRAAIGLGHAMGLQLLATGVTTGAQLVELRAHGCELAQGPYFQPPLTPLLWQQYLSLQAQLVDLAAPAPLYSILYVSRATGVPCQQANWQERLERMRSGNRRANISGVLLAQGGCFLQMLEGSQGALDALWERIGQDETHGKLRVVHQGFRATRLFAGHDLLFHDLDQLATSSVGDLGSVEALSLFDLARDARLCYAWLAALAA
jgi:diguanylate cyclase (GGDEF)-like protein/PAS domain S-box-containing protein